MDFLTKQNILGNLWEKDLIQKSKLLL